ncbi:hypothetical protein JMJ56_30310 [Belnapia sp. T18]|uniref:Uncharacterized protein n=1 Tax=Belnapia arida TaxID=2804533 RepID=A0ABS1UC73_9PROT|nr:hypothetical protein [Belnapia arida]MBL6082273.1 hypothetical protein [Belnapia arida]
MQGPKDSQLSKPAPIRRTRQQAAGKGAPPSPTDTLGAIPAESGPRDQKASNKAKEKERSATPKAPTKQRTEPLNFRVTPEFRRAFKRAAAAEDCKKVELLERIFADWRARNPS